MLVSLSCQEAGPWEILLQGNPIFFGGSESHLDCVSKLWHEGRNESHPEYHKCVTVPLCDSKPQGTLRRLPGAARHVALASAHCSSIWGAMETQRPAHLCLQHLPGSQTWASQWPCLEAFYHRGASFLDACSPQGPAVRAASS